MRKREILLAALEILDQKQRNEYLDEVCQADTPLRAEMDRLLGSYSLVTSVLDVSADSGSETPQPPLTAAWFSEFIENDVAVNTAEGQHDDIGRADDDRVVTGCKELQNYLLPSSRPGWIGAVSHFEIESILGSGAFGIVAKAFDCKLHRVVAIKFMKPDLAATSPPRKRFLREARATAAAKHANIVSIHAVEEDPIPYLVMEFVAGSSLQEKMDKEGPFDLDEALLISRQIANALVEAHSLGLIHRDIKPANILLANNIDTHAKLTVDGFRSCAFG